MPEQNNWKEEFEKLFGKDSELVKFLTAKYGTHIHHETVFTAIELFIEDKLSFQAQQMKEKMKEKMKEILDSVPSKGYNRDYIHKESVAKKINDL